MEGLEAPQSQNSRLSYILPAWYRSPDFYNWIWQLLSTDFSYALLFRQQVLKLKQLAVLAVPKLALSIWEDLL